MTHSDQLAQMRNNHGFVAALDQSGGSTPKALGLYGVTPDMYNDDVEMFTQMHAMRVRIMKAQAFNGEKVVGAILFERTMDETVDGIFSAGFLWNNKGVVPFLKVDKGLEVRADGVQLMKAMPELDALLTRAVAKEVFGTKMRSVIHRASAHGIEAIVDQQFKVGRQIISHGLVPIIEPEISIEADDKAECENMLNATLKAHLDGLSAHENVMLKLTLPEAANHYGELISHPRVVRVVALSGGYSQGEANRRLTQNSGLIASFSRALTEGLQVSMSDAEFDAAIGVSIDGIYQASVS